MSSPDKLLILVVDDDNNILKLIKSLLNCEGYDVMIAQSGFKAFEILRDVTPDLILLDVMMPDMDGYAFCYRLQQKSETAFIPVVFVTGLKKEKDRTKAFALGAVGYLTKPIQKDILLENLKYHLDRTKAWQHIPAITNRHEVSFASPDFIVFKESMLQKLPLSPEQQFEFESMTHTNLYSMVGKFGIEQDRMSGYVAEFLKLPHLSSINPDNVELGVLPIPFCRSNLVIAMRTEHGGRAFALSNPFNLEVLDYLGKLSMQGEPPDLIITSPTAVRSLLMNGTIIDQPIGDKHDEPEKCEEVIFDKGGDEGSAVQYDFDSLTAHDIANNVLYDAVKHRTSDVHIDMKKKNAFVRFRVDGDMRTIFTLSRDAGFKLISRFKAIGDMDIAEKRRPQDGTLEVAIGDQNYKLRLATTSTPEGESLVIRLLEPYAKPRQLGDLGMSEKQAIMILDAVERTHGLILVVGPTGSGKTTTIYSLLSHLDCETRNLITIEDPVEYRMLLANQQQVNEKAGITFEILLKSVVRLDPDVIFLGEIRDPYSARMAMDFASTGHLTFTTLHTTNTTTAVFRLERLGVNRGVMADSVLCVVAQRLVKKLCRYCKKIVKTSAAEVDMLARFTDKVPEKVAHPVGCSKCYKTGYWGREGLYEILRFDPMVADMVRSGKPISEIRNFFRDNGVYLISNHAIEKVRDHIFAPRDVYQTVLAEDIEILNQTKK